MWTVYNILGTSGGSWVHLILFKGVRMNECEYYWRPHFHNHVSFSFNFNLMPYFQLVYLLWSLCDKCEKRSRGVNTSARHRIQALEKFQFTGSVVRIERGAYPLSMFPLSHRQAACSHTWTQKFAGLGHIQKHKAIWKANDTQAAWVTHSYLHRRITRI